MRIMMIFNMWINSSRWINSIPNWAWFLPAGQNDFSSWFPFSFISLIERRDKESWTPFSSWHKSCCYQWEGFFQGEIRGFSLAHSGWYESMLAGIGTCPLRQPARRIRLGIVRSMNGNPPMDRRRNLFLTYSCQFCAYYCQFFDDRVDFTTMLPTGFRVETGDTGEWSYPGDWNKWCLSQKTDIP